MKKTTVLLIVVTLSGCAPSPPKVQRIDFGLSIWSDGQRRAGVLFQDGGQAIPVEGGTVWLFGDTFIGQALPSRPPERAEIKGTRGTTLAYLPAGRTNLPPALEYFTDSTGAAGNPLELLPEESPERYRMWPAGGMGIGPHVYLYYSMVEKTGGAGPWNFRGVGAGLAVGAMPPHQFKRLIAQGRWKFPLEAIQVLRQGDWLYLYEVRTNGLILGRVASAEIENPTAYEFYSGGGWSKERDNAKALFREAYGQVSVMWMPSRQRYLMATSSDFFHPREIQLRQASHPEGPWSRPARLAVPELTGAKTTLVYGTFLHPELSEAGLLRVMATFCRTLAGEWQLSNPEWVTITLAPD